MCPYCGVGCQLTYHVKDNRILYVEGRDGPANHERLCVKGRYGFDYAHHPQRLTKPLIRRAGVPKRGDFDDGSANASWTCSAKRPGTRRWRSPAAACARSATAHGPKALAGFGSAKGSNEEAYLFQKLVRTGFGSNNVDHCTRLCHASSVAALLEGIGSGAVSQPGERREKADVVLLIGANPTVNHPVAATWMKNAAKRGTKLIVCDPRRTELSRHRAALPAVQARHRRRAAQRDDARHRRRGPGRRGLHRQPHHRLRRAARQRRGATRPRRWRRSAASPPRRSARWRALYATSKALDDPVGHGHLAARARHRQRALPDRAVADDRPDRPARHRAASAARPEQRAGRVATPG